MAAAVIDNTLMTAKQYIAIRDVSVLVKAKSLNSGRIVHSDQFEDD